MTAHNEQNPGFGGGYAQWSGESQYPTLWRGLIGLWVPSLGSQPATLVDRSGRGANAAYSGMTSDSWVPGRQGAGLKFNGTTSCCTIGTNALYDLTAFTVMAWVNTGSLGNGSQAYIFYRGNGSNQEHISVWLLGGQQLTVEYFDSSLGVDYFARSPKNIQDGLWHHIACVRLPGVYMRTFVDGKLDNQGSDGGLNATGSFTFRISGRTGGDNMFNGKLDDCRIYNRALDPSEIALSATGASPLTLARSMSMGKALVSAINAPWFFYQSGRAA